MLHSKNNWNDMKRDFLMTEYLQNDLVLATFDAESGCTEPPIICRFQLISKDLQLKVIFIAQPCFCINLIEGNVVWRWSMVSLTEHVYERPGCWLVESSNRRTGKSMPSKVTYSIQYNACRTLVFRLDEGHHHICYISTSREQHKIGDHFFQY